VFESTVRPSSITLRLVFEVGIEATVAGLRARGIVFEEYGLRDSKTATGISQVAGN